MSTLPIQSARAVQAAPVELPARAGPLALPRAERRRPARVELPPRVEPRRLELAERPRAAERRRPERVEPRRLELAEPRLPELAERAAWCPLPARKPPTPAADAEWARRVRPRPRRSA